MGELEPPAPPPGYATASTWVVFKWLLFTFTQVIFLVSTLYFTSSSFFVSNETFTWVQFSSTFYITGYHLESLLSACFHSAVVISLF